MYLQMLRYSFLLLSLSLLTLTPSLARQDQEQQNEALERLMDERDRLLDQYERYEKTNSSFWGTKSKKDLKNIIGTLKNIIRKDTEVVRAVRASQVNKESGYITQNHFTTKRITELESEVSKYRSQAARRYKELQELEREANTDASYRIKYHLAILVSILLAGGLFFFAYRYLQLVRAGRSAHSPA